MVQDNHPPMTRQELQRVIAGALRRSLSYLNQQQALAAADTILRDLKAAGVTMRRRRPEDGP